MINLLLDVALRRSCRTGTLSIFITAPFNRSTSKWVTCANEEQFIITSQIQFILPYKLNPYDGSSCLYGMTTLINFPYFSMHTWNQVAFESYCFRDSLDDFKVNVENAPQYCRKTRKSRHWLVCGCRGRGVDNLG